MGRWNYDAKDKGEVRTFKKLLWLFRTGRHASGLRLECILLGGQHRRYRLADVMALELDLREWHRKRC